MSKSLQVLSLFSGIGAYEKALTKINVDYQVIYYSEIDKYASKVYSVIHNIPEEFNLGDITTVNEKELPDFDLVTYSFPCQDISLAGKQKGLIDENGNKTRSGLLFDALRIIKYKKPKYAITENVKGLVTKKFRKDFEWFLRELESYGYNNYWKVLNAKDYGIPQNRERVFVISIRKDIKKSFEFPPPIGLKKKLVDILEQQVDEKYYIDDKTTHIFLKSFKYDMLEIKSNNIILVGSLDIKGYKSIRRVYSPYGIAPTLTTMTGGNRQPKIILRDNGKWVIKHDDITTCLDANYHKGIDNHRARATILSEYKIRKLTPLECWRLMGFNDEDFWKAKNTLNTYFYYGKDKSDTQLYKMAGNSIVVDVLMYIFQRLFE